VTLAIPQGEAVVFLVVTAVMLYYQYAGISGKKFELRPLNSVNAIDDVIDRAVEIGKPVFVSPGSRAELMGPLAPMSISGLNVTRYVAHACAKKGAKFFITAPFAKGSQLMPLLDGILRESYVLAGKPEGYRREDVLYFGSLPSTYTMGLCAKFAREGIAGMISVGSLSTGGSFGALGFVRMFGGILIAGTARYHANGPMVLLADYPFIGDDVLVAGSYVTDDPVMKSGIAGSDLVKLFMIGLILLVVVGTLAGINIADWIGKAVEAELED
jgi:hypothetical protein